ncbi:hypothetical protein [Usitatibacter palustris]|uniref:DUF1311 domain-containing protein n=1 Tax=Usitatibacter palustris TaxID=2732487 RepID=A0A6M4H588_9PROT|nr:hypothetical protein [Usitatibacter palustris]QJR14819.1 hypothetical protein DSM104440_01629 [Usitatibacter palustris]
MIRAIPLLVLSAALLSPLLCTSASAADPCPAGTYEAAAGTVRCKPIRTSWSNVEFEVVAPLKFVKTWETEGPGRILANDKLQQQAKASQQLVNQNLAAARLYREQALNGAAGACATARQEKKSGLAVADEHLRIANKWRQEIGAGPCPE